ncbi:MAG: sigma-70 family RNA polymerase sigma factor [Deltaproteobacteria bacterium]|nr:sigma-70 family RNA polymerase sigma factor [Deltaproteobacteria bacterium]
MNANKGELSETRSDLELILAAQAGNYHSFEELVRRYHSRVFRLAYGMIKNKHDTQEAVQDTFLNIFRSLAKFRQNSTPGSWIFRIATNSALMRLRTKKRKPLTSIENIPDKTLTSSNKSLWAVPYWTQQPDEKLLSLELAHHLQDAITRLPEKYRLVLLLRDVEGLDNEQVAQVLNLSIPTIKSRLHRSRLFVRDELERYFNKE